MARLIRQRMEATDEEYDVARANLADDPAANEQVRVL